MNILKNIKGDVNKSINKVCENTNKQWYEMGEREQE